MAEREYKFSAVLNFATSYRRLGEATQDSELREIAESYASNIERVRSLGKMPISVVNIAEVLDNERHAWMNNLVELATRDSALRRLTEIPDDAVDPSWWAELRAQDERFNKAIAEKFQVILRERDEWVRRREIEQNQPSGIGTHKSDAFVERTIGLTNTTTMDEFKRGVEATLSGIVIGAWSAFEVLATDLWVHAVNRRPNSLGVSAIKSSALPGFLRGGNVEKKKEIALSLDILREYRFELHKCMGTILKEKRGFSFNTSDDIMAAYQSAFSHTNSSGTRTAAPPEVDSWFKKNECYNELNHRPA